ncbi:lipid A deacylase LpxR family protein [Daejeonella sp.]|uniref:lipid A deacylase LpxR family protein n=1 Tax=Daejeonella sp. TaxID=2805397 RepID=UPI0030BC0CA1
MRIFVFCLLFAVFISSICYAQQTGFKNEFGFRSDNDAYLAYGQDRYYTNGLFIYFRRATDQSKLSKQLNKVIWEAEAGQKMYNPQSGNITDITYVDRPFAAYLYAGGSLNLLFNSENSLKIAIQAGTIGPDAKGKETQELLHSIVGFYEINGWEWQVNNEVAFNSTISYKNLLLRTGSSKLDLSLDSYLNLGNTYAGAGAGFMFRTGDLNQLFHSASTESVVSNNSKSADLTKKELFFYAKPMLHYVAYDATIQGGLFSSDKGPVVFDAKPLVFSQLAGVMYSKKRWMADFSLIFKSREIKSIARPHQYGSAALYYRFN